ncbi:preprotein translocase subunit SecA [soil metagenome]
MLDFINKAINKFFGTKSDKDIKEVMPYVEKVQAIFPSMQALSNDQLRGKTQEFKNRIAEGLKEIDGQIESLRTEAKGEDLDPDSKEVIYKQVDELNKQRDKQLEVILLEIMPEAFAVVKETARRFKENSTLTATATQLDRDLAVGPDHISITGNQVTYQNNWLAAGIRITWDMVHYDVQLIGGAVLHTGKIAEMATGEGKTLVATLPAYLNGLTGQGVHIVTVNDYLARRDSEWMAPLLNFLGLTVDCIDKYEPNSEERRDAYNADITYGTNNEFGFDYLRDNMTRTPEELVQRKHHYAMVDEVDSVLVDDARTPLIISGPVPKNDIQEYMILKPRIERLVDAQKKAINTFLNQAKKDIESGKTSEKEAGLALLRAHRAFPRYKPLIKFMSEPGNKVIMQKAENHYMSENNKRMPEVDDELFFVIEEKQNSVDLTEQGIDLITGAGEDKTFFVMPDVGAEVADIEKSDLPDDEKVARKDQLMQDFAIKAERLHIVQQLLKAYALFERDTEYVVVEGKVKIVDENTGRIMEGRRYSDGLHQAIEAKENVKVEGATQTYATVTLQNYFRMYHKLAGMTGTAETEAGELWEIYKLDVVVIPTNRNIVRDDQQDVVYKTKRTKYNAVIDHIAELREKGRPVLVGTTSVEISELMGRMLRQRNIPHNVLNAKQHQREAEIVAEAGRAGTITIATNMAGRGTDIKLGPGVKEAGGLAIVGTERHDSRRVDRQLRGRAGRQGDNGSSLFFVSLEDDLMRRFGSDRIAGVMDKLGYKEDEVIQHSMITKSIERAQQKVEENNFGMRKRLLEYDDVMNAQREVIYRRRKNALFGERLAVDVSNMFYDLCEDLVTTFRNSEDFEGFRLDAIRYLSVNPAVDEEGFRRKSISELSTQLYDQAWASYKRKCEHLAQQAMPLLLQVRGGTYTNVLFPFTDGVKQLRVVAPIEKSIETQGHEVITSFEKAVVLGLIDEAWKNHLREMDDLKQAVHGAVYEQKDPLLVYKLEAFELFKTMVATFNRDVVSFLCKGGLPVQQQEIRSAPTEEKTDLSRLKAGRDENNSVVNPNAAQQPQQPQERKLEPVRVEDKIGRNDLCPCGSGKKYKQCHGKEQ